MAALDVTPNALIGAVAEELKKKPEIKPPAWAGLVKTGAHAERVPESADFWFARCASLLRNAYKAERPLGVRRMRNKYGGAKQHIVSRSHHTRAGGKAIRLAFQQLEKAGLMKKEKVGRTITPAGRSLLDKASRKAEGVKVA